MTNPLGQVLIQTSPFETNIMGNHALVRAMVESHTRVVASYPGSPTPEIASAIQAIPEADRPFYFEFSVNEKVATEVAFGAALNGNLSCAFYKSVGLNVALDAFIQLGLLNIPGGMVVVLGDDPGANSSQNEQDNRNIYRMARVAVLEPASPVEAYHYYKIAAAMAQTHETVVVLRMTTHVCHARQTISFSDYTPSGGFASRFSRDNGPYIPLTTMALEMKQKTMARFERIREDVKKAGLNRVTPGTMSPGPGGDGNRTFGIITSGLTYLSVMDVLEEAKERPDVLKLGAVMPLDHDLVAEFLAGHKEVLVLEELDDILETQIKAIAFDRGLDLKILGKACQEDYIGEFTPDRTQAKLASVWPDLVPAPARPVQDLPEVPARPAQMCPGCGHRSAFHAIKQALSAHDVTVADIGCHTLGYMPPYEMGEVLMCMGASPGIASGLSLENKKKNVVAFIGDSTFFHAGLPGLINTILNRHNITLIIMENNTTAMTGHQDHAGKAIRIPDLLTGLGIDQVFSCDTYSQTKLTELVGKAMAVKGISVVIARHPCMLKFTREQRKKGRKTMPVSIDPERCNRAHTCIADFGCPTFTLGEAGAVTINPDLCIGDGSCVQVCPETAIRRPEKDGDHGL